MLSFKHASVFEISVSIASWFPGKKTLEISIQEVYSSTIGINHDEGKGRKQDWEERKVGQQYSLNRRPREP